MKKILGWLVFAGLMLVEGTGLAQVTNAQYSVIASGAQTAAQVNSADQTNTYYRGVHVIITVSAYTAGNYTVTLQGKDTTTGGYYTILVGTAISSTGTTVLKVYPGIGVLANGSASDMLPQTWRVQLNGAAGQSMTLSVDAVMEG